jgi:hypothetical protein
LTPNSFFPPYYRNTLIIIILYINYLTPYSTTSPSIQNHNNIFPSLPQFILGLSYAQFYRSHRGVLLLSLSPAFLHFSPVPSPSSRLCVPQLHLSFHAPVPTP